MTIKGHVDDGKVSYRWTDSSESIYAAIAEARREAESVLPAGVGGSVIIDEVRARHIGHRKALEAVEVVLGDGQASTPKSEDDAGTSEFAPPGDA